MDPITDRDILNTLQRASADVDAAAKACSDEMRAARARGEGFLPLNACPSFKTLQAANRERTRLRKRYHV